MANVPMCRSCDQYDDSRDDPYDVYSNNQGRCRECERKQIEKEKLTNAINRLSDLLEGNNQEEDSGLVAEFIVGPDGYWQWPQLLDFEPGTKVEIYAKKAFRF